MLLDWEQIDEGGKFWTPSFRLKVPGGWILRVGIPVNITPRRNPISPFFIDDPEYEWESSLPVKCCRTCYYYAQHHCLFDSEDQPEVYPSHECGNHRVSNINKTHGLSVVRGRNHDESNGL